MCIFKKHKRIPVSCEVNKPQLESAIYSKTKPLGQTTLDSQREKPAMMNLENLGYHFVSNKMDKGNTMILIDSHPSELSRTRTSAKYNDVCLQPLSLRRPLSQTWGQHCLTYLIHQCQDINTNTYVHRFSNNLIQNDVLVSTFIQSL